MCPSGRILTTHAAASDFRPAFEVLDADRDGKISRDDLRAFYAGVHGGVGGGDELIGAMMTVADTNKDGFVEYEEFERVVNFFPATDEDINAMILFGGGDKSGGVTLDGLLRILALDSAYPN
uniref:EF-hand domain-containing protein n=1 Tax=Phaseolus vulgaris TaxID=3885 RepID=V7C8C5_PHAVU|nr:hypothetical protein PHAVU_003G115800g [Phaseolus vulgaris]ESW26389.1 hypothetical protein PHAVU_003G115800g [Phaseolus vulgaris]